MKYLKRFVQFLFVGSLTPENIPNKKVRRGAITAAWLAGFFALQVEYYRSKLDTMAEHGLSELTFTGFLRYNDAHRLADHIDKLMGVDPQKERQRVMWDAMPAGDKHYYGGSFEKWYAEERIE